MKTKSEWTESDWLRTNRPGVRVPPGAPCHLRTQTTCANADPGGAIGFASFPLRFDQQLTSTTKRSPVADRPVNWRTAKR